MAWINTIGYSLLHSHSSGVRWVGQGMTGICLVGFASLSSELLNGVSGRPTQAAAVAAPIHKLWVLYLAGS